jgi:DNA-binding NtrC family response regulator
MNDRHILLVDDDPSITDALARLLRREGYRVTREGSAKEAFRVLAGDDVDVLITDDGMPGITGTELLAQVARRWPRCIRMMLTGSGSLETARRAINEGAVHHFFTKPCPIQEMVKAIEHAVQTRALSGRAPIETPSPSRR